MADSTSPSRFRRMTFTFPVLEREPARSWSRTGSLMPPLFNPPQPSRKIAVNGLSFDTQVSALDLTWRSIAWAPSLGLFAAVANSGAGNRIMTSPDGVVWTARATPADNDWRAITWSPDLSLFVVVGFGSPGQSAMTSPDGVNWTLRNAADNNHVWTSVTWSSGKQVFVAV